MNEFIIISHPVNKATRMVHFLGNRKKEEPVKAKTERNLKGKR